jgi:hypothetical protein
LKEIITALALAGCGFLPTGQPADARTTVADVREWASDNGYVAVHCEELAVEEAIGYNCGTTSGSPRKRLWSDAYPGEHPAGCMSEPERARAFLCFPYGNY